MLVGLIVFLLIFAQGCTLVHDGPRVRELEDEVAACETVVDLQAVSLEAFRAEARRCAEEQRTKAERLSCRDEKGRFVICPK